MRSWTLEDVAEHWDRTPAYDEINDQFDSYFRRFTDSEPLFSIPDGGRVLDVDCRTGRGTAYFSRRYPDAEFECAAMAPSFQARARRRFEDADLDVPVALFDELPLPYDESSFDVILSFETIEHVPWPGRYLRELARLLRPGGTLVLTTPNALWEPVHWFAEAVGIDHGEGPHRMLRRRELLTGLESAGFDVETERTFVLLPAGPTPLLDGARAIEARLPERVRRHLCLRRTVICEFTHD